MAFPTPNDANGPTPTTTILLPPAVHRVLHLPELLELILLHLSQRDLLLSQRISRTFHSTINTSPPILKALFLLPDTTPHPPPFSPATAAAIATSPSFSTRQPQARPNVKPANNRLLLRAFPGGEYPTVHLHIEYKPTLADLDSGRRGEEFYAWTVNISYPALSSPNKHKLPPACSPAAAYPEASWRRMYLCQPPCEELFLARRHMRSQEPAIVRLGGIRMGDFVEEATLAGDGEGKGKEGMWRSGFVSSDGDWHFEGEVGRRAIDEGMAWRDLPEEFEGYVYCRTSRDGRSRALSEEWNASVSVAGVAV